MNRSLHIFPLTSISVAVLLNTCRHSFGASLRWRYRCYRRVASSLQNIKKAVIEWNNISQYTHITVWGNPFYFVPSSLSRSAISCHFSPKALNGVWLKMYKSYQNSVYAADGMDRYYLLYHLSHTISFSQRDGNNHICLYSLNLRLDRFCWSMLILSGLHAPLPAPQLIRESHMNG